MGKQPQQQRLDGFGRRSLNRASLGQRGDPALAINGVQVVGNRLQQGAHTSFASLRLDRQGLANLQVAADGPKRGQGQRCHQQAADQCQSAALRDGVGHGLVGGGELLALPSLDRIEQGPQSIHDQLAAGLVQAFGCRLQADNPACLDVVGGNHQALGNIAVELLEPTLVGKRPVLQQPLQPTTVRFDLS